MNPSDFSAQDAQKSALTDLDQTLKQMTVQKQRKQKCIAMLASLRKQLSDMEREELRLNALWRKEQSDVDKLEKPTLTAFFYMVTGQKETQLDNEKAEAYSAAVKHETIVREIEAVKAEINDLKEEIEALEHIDVAYEDAFNQKKTALELTFPRQAETLTRIDKQMDALMAAEVEIDEALAVGKRALSQIDRIEKALGSAEGWGTWDLIGGGMISTLAKHSHLDRAQLEITDLQHILRKYRTELSDVEVHADIQAQIDGFLRFADYFFDGIFADWAALNHIQKSKEQLRVTKNQVKQVQNQLAELKRAGQRDLNDLKAQREQIILETH